MIAMESNLLLVLVGIMAVNAGVLPYGTKTGNVKDGTLGHHQGRWYGTAEESGAFSDEMFAFCAMCEVYHVQLRNVERPIVEVRGGGSNPHPLKSTEFMTYFKAKLCTDPEIPNEDETTCLNYVTALGSSIFNSIQGDRPPRKLCEQWEKLNQEPQSDLMPTTSRRHDLVACRVTDERSCNMCQYQLSYLAVTPLSLIKDWTEMSTAVRAICAQLPAIQVIACHAFAGMQRPMEDLIAAMSVTPLPPANENGGPFSPAVYTFCQNSGACDIL